MDREGIGPFRMQLLMEVAAESGQDHDNRCMASLTARQPEYRLRNRTMRC